MHTILDVEKKSGVSRSTISRYLNGRNVTDENRIKIEQAIKELSYHRNPMARGLKSSKTYTIGVVLPAVSDPFFPALMMGFQKYMRNNGYQIIFNISNNDPELEIKQVNSLVKNRVDGLVVVSNNKQGDHIQRCLDTGLPVVLLDRLIDGFECDSVTVDNYNAVYDAISLCIRRGHKKIAFLGSQFYTDNERLKGLCGALNKAGISIRDEYIVRAQIEEHDSARQFMRLLNLADPPTLIFCSNVYHSLGAFEAMLEHKIDIPGEVSVISFDRLSASPYYGFTKCIYPEFASICQPNNEVSIQTAKLLLDRIEKGLENYTPIQLELKTSFHMTESVAYL